jgi:hypothetical protein
LELQDELMGDDFNDNDSERAKLQAIYRDNIAKLTAEVDKV